MGPYYGSREAAEYCACSLDTINEARQRGDLIPAAGMTIGGRKVKGYRYSREELDRWMSDDRAVTQ